MSTEIAFGVNFNADRIVVGAPKASTDSNKYHTFPIKYGAGNFGIMETATVSATRLKDDPEKKPNILSQGFHLENADTLKMCEAAEQRIWEGLLKHKGADDKLPNYLKDAESVADLKAAGKFIKMKGLVHYPKGKDAMGLPTKTADPNITPLIYGKLIQNGAKPKNAGVPYHVHTKYYDAAILNPDVKLAIHEGRDKTENYLIKAVDLWKKKLAFKGKWCMVIGDVFCSDTVLKIRRSITECWVVSFTASESVGAKTMAAAIEKTGEKFEAKKLVIPAAVQTPDSDGEDDDSGGMDDVIVNKVPAKKAVGGSDVLPKTKPDADEKFEVKISLDGN